MRVPVVVESQRFHRARDSSRITWSTCEAGSSMFNNFAIISSNFTDKSVTQFSLLQLVDIRLFW